MMNFEGFGPDGAGSGGPVPFPVSGPGTSVISGDIAQFSNTSGQLIGDSGHKVSDFVLKSGSTMTGNLNMSGHNIVDAEYVLNIQSILPLSSAITYPIDVTADQVIIDSRNFITKCNMINPTVNRRMTVQLKYQYSYPVNIQTSHGTFQLNCNYPIVDLAFLYNPNDNTGNWIIINQGTTLGNKPPTSSFITGGTTLVATGGPGGLTFLGPIEVSADGLYIAAGAPAESTNDGSTYIYFYNGSAWTQQARLVGTSHIGNAFEGCTISMSADGSTVFSGANSDNTNVGCVFVYVRSGATWTQQAKLLATGTITTQAFFGTYTACSCDGNILIVGAPNDNSNAGAVYIFKRTSGTWSQIQRITGTGTDSSALFGGLVVCNLDASILAIGAYGDASFAGATCFFYSPDLITWTQQGSKLTEPNLFANNLFPGTPALSLSGNAYLAGSVNQHASIQPCLLFKCSNFQNGTAPSFVTNLVGTASTNANEGQGQPIFSADQQMILSGGWGADSGVGAMWLFGSNSINTNATNVTWNQLVPKISPVGGNPGDNFGLGLAASSDFSVVAVVSPNAGGVGEIIVYQ